MKLALCLVALVACQADRRATAADEASRVWVPVLAPATDSLCHPDTSTGWLLRPGGRSLCKTAFAGPNMWNIYGADKQISASSMLRVQNNVWLLGVMTGNQVKMVKIRITGATSYEWLETRWCQKCGAFSQQTWDSADCGGSGCSGKFSCPTSSTASCGVDGSVSTLGDSCDKRWGLGIKCTVGYKINNFEAIDVTPTTTTTTVASDPYVQCHARNEEACGQNDCQWVTDNGDPYCAAHVSTAGACTCPNAAPCRHENDDTCGPRVDERGWVVHGGLGKCAAGTEDCHHSAQPQPWQEQHAEGIRVGLVVCPQSSNSALVPELCDMRGPGSPFADGTVKVWKGAAFDMADRTGCECSAVCGLPCQFGGYKCGFLDAACNHVNECDVDDACLNGGTCRDGIGKYTCECNAGFTGARCEINVDDCASDPCQNGGECNDGVNSFTCDCTEGWGGATCDTPEPCTEVEHCSGNGTPSGDQIVGCTCSCVEGWTGDTCDTPQTTTTTPAPGPKWTNLGAGGCKCNDCVATNTNVRRLSNTGRTWDIDACKVKCEEYDWCQSAEVSTQKYCHLGVRAGVSMPSVGGWQGRDVDGQWWVDKEVTMASGNTNQAANCWKLARH